MNGTAIDGATSASYEITDTASYSVAVQQFAQCPVISSPEVAVNFVAVEELPYAVTGINVYPNPSAGQFTLQANAMSTQQATLRTVDSAGRIVQEQTIVLNQGSNQINLDHKLPSGYYQLQLIAGASIYRQGLIIK